MAIVIRRDECLLLHCLPPHVPVQALSYHRYVTIKHEDEQRWQHPVFMDLGSNKNTRLLFRYDMDDETLHEIRGSLKYEIVLGRSYFKHRIEVITNRWTRLGVPGDRE